jgi:hypothetical protein
MNEMDQFLASALAEFEDWLLKHGWRGKENDCVNLFAHGFLFPRIRPGAAVDHFTRVGIEVGVPQPVGLGIKLAVRKDLVIWEKAFASTWDDQWQAATCPQAIIEWKARRKHQGAALLDERDLNWLRRYSVHYPKFVGYAVTVDFTAADRRLTTARVEGGTVVEGFHRRH